jgi:hypothetical protein
MEHSPDRAEIVGGVAREGGEIVAQARIGMGSAQSRHEL